MYRQAPKLFIFLTVAACQGSASPTLSGTRLSASAVQDAIDANHAGWKADASASAHTHRLGVALSSLPTQPMDLSDIDSDAAKTLPATFDWRNNNGKNYVSPILDQGDCGSCVAFATTGTFESQLNISAGDTTSPFELSPQYIFSCGGGACDEGWDADSAAEFLTKTGMPDDACLPYASGANDQDVECSAACSDHATRALKATKYSTPKSSITAVKTALLHGPLVATMTVYDDFMSYKSGVYKHVTGAVDGGHAVSIIGWNDADKAWICRNSWGTDWGMNGFFEIAYTDVSGVGAQTWSFTVTAPASYVSTVGVRDASVLSGETQPLSFETQGMTDPSVSWTLAPQTSSASVSGASGVATNGSSAAIDTTTVKDGVYVLQAHAAAGGKTIASEPREVYVLNGAESGAITFTGLKAGQTVSGVYNIDFSVNVHPIPLTGVQFTITDATGAVVTNDTLLGNTATTMEIDWDTSRHPNGKYTIGVAGLAANQTLAPATIAVTIAN